MANMAKQMELFDEGGLMQEGGTIDPVSGNDVPVGSTQEEVRDDIPAQLSEAEIETEVMAVIAQVGAEGMKDMGKVMGIVSQKLAGQADGKTISTIVKSKLM